jgi:hypothetical protein
MTELPPTPYFDTKRKLNKEEQDWVNSGLGIAITKNKKEEVEFFLNMGANPACAQSGRYFFENAIERADLDIIKIMWVYLKKNMPEACIDGHFEATDHEDNLGYEGYKRYKDEAERKTGFANNLLKKWIGVHPLRLAIKNDRSDVAQWLIEQGVSKHLLSVTHSRKEGADMFLEDVIRKSTELLNHIVSNLGRRDITDYYTNALVQNKWMLTHLAPQLILEEKDHQKAAALGFGIKPLDTRLYITSHKFEEDFYNRNAYNDYEFLRDGKAPWVLALKEWFDIIHDFKMPDGSEKEYKKNLYRNWFKDMLDRRLGHEKALHAAGGHEVLVKLISLATEKASSEELKFILEEVIPEGTALQKRNATSGDGNAEIKNQALGQLEQQIQARLLKEVSGDVLSQKSVRKAL